VRLDPQARKALIRLASGDARRVLTALEAASVSAASTEPTAEGTDSQGTDPAATAAESPAVEASDRVQLDEAPLVTAELVSRAVDRALLRYDRNGDEHYDVISAFIKSVRGSDVDASLHYLARMIEAGEDPRFIARRIIVLASEDIGMADPQALQVAIAAADAVQYIGMPEGRIPLAQAVVHLATAPKSNSAYMALDAALADVRAGRIGRVPKHLRDAHYPGAKRLGHGKGYVYPHDDDLGVVKQQYLPNELTGASYYHPTEHGNEREISARLAKLLKIVRGR
jgi:putative ATPase